MSVYTGYFDESGHEHDQVFVMGGIAIDADESVSFDEEWLVAIDKLPLLNGTARPYLHTSDFMGGNNDFTSWKGRFIEKSEILADVARVIRKYAVQTFTCVLNMDDYRKINAEVQFSDLMGEPYAVLARVCWAQLNQWGRDCNLSNPVLMVMEQRHGYGEVVQIFENDNQPIPQPAPKGTCAVQAADYVAWMRLQRLCPSSSYAHVSGTWDLVNTVLHTDYVPMAA